MSSALETAQGFYGALGEGDMEKMFSFFAENVEWRLVGSTNIPYFGTYQGIEGVQDFFTRHDEHEQIEDLQILEFLEGNDAVTVLGTESCRAKHTNKTFQAEWAHIISVRNGKITRFLEYIDTAPMEAAYNS